MELITFEVIKDDLTQLIDLSVSNQTLATGGNCGAGCAADVTGGSCGWGCYKQK